MGINSRDILWDSLYYVTSHYFSPPLYKLSMLPRMESCCTRSMEVFEGLHVASRGSSLTFGVPPRLQQTDIEALEGWLLTVENFTEILSPCLLIRWMNSYNNYYLEKLLSISLLLFFTWQLFRSWVEYILCVLMCVLLRVVVCVCVCYIHKTCDSNSSFYSNSQGRRCPSRRAVC